MDQVCPHDLGDQSRACRADDLGGNCYLDGVLRLGMRVRGIAGLRASRARHVSESISAGSIFLEYLPEDVA